MKKIVTLILLCAVTLYSCKSDTEPIEQIITPDINLQNILKEKIISTTTDIMSYAYDYNSNSLKYDAVEEILNKNRPNNTDPFTFSENFLSKSSSDSIINTLSNEQYLIYDEIIKMSKNKSIDYEYLYKMVSRIRDNDERNDMFIAVCSLQSLELGLEEVLIFQTKGWFGSFMCNVACGGIGSVYGMWGAAIIGGVSAATGGAALVAGIVISSAMSALIC